MRRSRLRRWARVAGSGIWKLLVYSAGRLFRSVFGAPEELAIVLAVVALSLLGLLAVAFGITFGQSGQWGRMMAHVNREWIPIAFGGGIAGYIIAKRRSQQVAAKPAANCCTRCGYNLTGNVSGVCPECGAPVPSTPTPAPPIPPPYPRKTLVFDCLIALGFVGAAAFPLMLQSIPQRRTRALVELYVGLPACIAMTLLLVLWMTMGGGANSKLWRVAEWLWPYPIDSMGKWLFVVLLVLVSTFGVLSQLGIVRWLD